MPRTHWGVAAAALEEQPLRFEVFESIRHFTKVDYADQDIRNGRKRKKGIRDFLNENSYKCEDLVGTCFMKCAYNESPFRYNSISSQYQ